VPATRGASQRRCIVGTAKERALLVFVVVGAVVLTAAIILPILHRQLDVLTAALR